MTFCLTRMKILTTYSATKSLNSVPKANNTLGKTQIIWAVGAAQLAERSLQASEIHRLNPNNDKFICLWHRKDGSREKNGLRLKLVNSLFTLEVLLR